MDPKKLLLAAAGILVMAFGWWLLAAVFFGAAGNKPDWNDGARYDPKDPIKVSYGKPVGDEPTGAKNPELLKVKPSHGHDNTIINGISRIGYMTGGKSARWVDEDMADVITRRAINIEKPDPLCVSIGKGWSSSLPSN